MKAPAHCFLAAIRALLGACPLIAAPLPLPEEFPGAVADIQVFQIPDRVQLGGWLGSRIEANERNRLLKLEPARLLEGYTKRPGRDSSDGEFVGKWLHAATLAWVNTHDAALREKLDLVAHGLCQCQMADGYLGTYLEKDRWVDWDVWAHKYNLLGLIAHARYTGNQESLDTCRRMGDLLCRTLGDGPEQRDIIKVGGHVGMASTSVLEPMVLLYRLTGEKRYLDFCNYILRAWEQPDGPHILSTLLTTNRVDKVANGKAYEMLSCLNGVAELYRTTGERRLLEAVLIAWQDIVEKRLYLTGTASYRERFHDDNDLPNDLNVGENCVTVSWLQLNAELLRLTGEARFAEQLERTTLNQLLGAQRPDGTGWCMYAPLSGQKAFNDSKDILTCCTASGPRGVALIPTFAVTTMAGGIAVNIFAPSKAELTLTDGHQVSVSLDTQYPADGLVRLTLHSATPHEFVVKLRIPAWCQDARLSVNDKPLTTPVRAGDYASVQRSWRDGDVITLQLPLTPRLLVGEHYENWNRLALAYGPLVLAADDRLNPTIKVGQFRVPKTEVGKLDFKVEQPGHVYSIKAQRIDTGEPVVVRLAPFAEAGSTRETYQVWMERFQF
jgi:DUF1680 family protein